MGKVSLPLDVRSSSDIPAFEKILEKGPMAVVLVYADWCGHCDTYKKNVWNPLKSLKNKTMNMASVHYDQLANTSISNAKLEGYPSVLVVGKDKIPATFNSNSGTTNAMPTSNDASTMKRLVTTPVPAPAPYQENSLPDIIVPDETNTTIQNLTTPNVDEDIPNISTSVNENVPNTSINNLTPPNLDEDETKPNTSINTNSKTEGVNITRNGNLKNTIKRNTQGTTPLLRGGRLYSRLTKRNRKKRSSKRKN